MTSIPEWPTAPGPRVLTLVGNDLTIDARARKTASSLARAGFSVISIGIDNLGDKPRTENLDGALLWRVTPPTDPRVSGRVLRLSLSEWVDRLRYRVELQRNRLQISRRNLVAWSAINRPGTSRPTADSRLSASLRRLGLPARSRSQLLRSSGSRLDRSFYSLVLFLRRTRTLWLQRRHQATTIIYKTLVRASQRRKLGRGSWRSDLPEQHKYEAALGSTIDYLQPDLIHVHDIFHLGLAARAKARGTIGGRNVKVVYDAHEYIPGLPSDPRRRAAYTDLEEEYITSADAVVTVSYGLAQLLRDRYDVEANIVLNAPDLDVTVGVRPVREVIGLDDSSTLLLYIGGVAVHRGGDLLLDSIEHLDPAIHLVLVTNTTSGYVDQLHNEAVSRGIADRVHFAPFVEPEGVVEYIRSADIGVIPLSREIINYEVALPNKLFQSIHAGLPVAVSDNPEMASFVREHGFGEVFDGQDARSLAAAIQRITSTYSRYRDALQTADLTEFTWKAQAEKLVSTYSSLGISL